MGFWDDDDYNTDSDFVKFEKVGDGIEGKITHLAKGRDFNGNPAPELWIETAEDGIRKVTAGQIDLKIKVVELAPAVGDHVSIYLTDEVKVEKGKKKVFEVKRIDPPAPIPF